MPTAQNMHSHAEDVCKIIYPKPQLLAMTAKGLGDTVLNVAQKKNVLCHANTLNGVDNMKYDEYIKSATPLELRKRYSTDYQRAKMLGNPNRLNAVQAAYERAVKDKGWENDMVKLS